MNISIRKAVPEDAAGLAKLNQQFNSVAVKESTVEFSLMNNKSEKVLIAVLENTLVGFVCLQATSSFCYLQSTAELTELYVAEPYRKKGIGKRLITSAIKLCRELEIPHVHLRTNPYNEVAIKLYESLGFQLHKSNFYQIEIGSDQSCP